MYEQLKSNRIKYIRQNIYKLDDCNTVYIHLFKIFVLVFYALFNFMHVHTLNIRIWLIKHIM